MSRNHKSKPSVIVVCSNCGKEAKKYVSQMVGDTCYCSRDCYFSAKGKGMSLPDQRGDKNPFWKGGRSQVDFTCEICGEVTKDWADSGRRFCSKLCESMYPRGYEFRQKMSDSQRGPRNPNWKGGITEASRALRNVMEYKAWRRGVYDIDDHACVRCGARGGCLHAHHIDSFAGNPEFRFDPDNGVTFCEDCHFLVHSKEFRADVQNYATGCVIRGEHACVL